MITSVALEHWRSHVRSELAFGPGVNVLVGMMGGGKSSVMDAICFSLFGTFPGLQQRRVALDELLLRFPQQRKEGEVSVSFERGGKRYRVSRRVALGKGTVEAELREDGALREANPANVTREVERILGVDYDLFAKAVYAEQDGLDSFLRLPRGQRTAQIDRMLQLEGFASVRESAVAVANRVEAARSAEQRLLLEAERERVEERLGEAIGALAGMREEALSAARTAAEARESARAAQEAAAAAEASAERVRALEVSAERAKSALAERRKQLSELAAALSAPVAAVDAAGVEALRAQALEQERVRAGAEHEARELQARSLQLGGGEECPVCEQPLPAERRAHVTKERAERLAAARARIQEAGSALLRLGGAVRALEHANAEAQRALARREAAQATERTLRSAVAELEARCAGLEAERGAAGTVDAAALAAARKAAVQASSAAAGAAARAHGLEGRVRDAEALVKERSAAVARVAALRERVAASGEVAAGLRKFVNALEQAQELLRAEYLGAVNRAMGQVWEALYPYGDFEEVRLRREGDYVLELRGPAGWMPADGVASGGERALAALALRIAFSLAFAPGLRWLVLDEPTHNLDGAAVQLLAQALRERLGGVVEQAFVVTHDERLAEAGSRVYRLERDEGKRTPTKVVAV